MRKLYEFENSNMKKYLTVKLQRWNFLWLLIHNKVSNALNLYMQHTIPFPRWNLCGQIDDQWHDIKHGSLSLVGCELGASVVAIHT